MKEPLVAAVVLGWNLRDETVACGMSLLAQRYAGLRLIFVDNGSTDGSPACLRSRFPDATVIELGTNVGIAAGYNAGLERALAVGADYALIVNNDTLFAPDMLRELVRAAEGHAEAGVVMPKILYEADRRLIWSAGARGRAFPPGVVFVGLRQPDGAAYDQPGEVQYAPSCALLIRRDTLRTVGLFDPGYFFYFDDWDYCERVRRAGRTIRYVPTSVVYHKVSLSTAQSARPARWWYVMGRSATLFYRRYYRPAGPALLLFAAWFAARESVQGNVAYVPLFVRGLLDALRGRPMRPIESGA